MKRFYIYLVSLALLALGGCTKEPADVLQAEPDYANVELSSTSVVMSEEEGTYTLFVSTNRVEWEVQEQCSWLDVSIEGSSITLFADRNNSSEGRMGVVEVVAGADPDVARARLKVYQQGRNTQNLSKMATANCYIVPTNGSYLFDASVKGNGGGDGNSRYIEFAGTAIENATYASLAWEATYDGDKTRSTKIIHGEPVYDALKRAVYFSTGEMEGNALITLHAADGTILWSWHIWVMNEEVTTAFANGFHWMDRNLGAITAAEGDIRNRGMLYQWGRKEPFLPSMAEYMFVPSHSYDDEGYLLETEEEYLAIEEEIVAARTLANVINPQVGDGNQQWNTVGEVAPVALAAPGNIDYSLQHPTTILGCRTDIPIGEYVFDWYLQQDLQGKGSVMQQSQSYLWGDGAIDTKYKTIFDPCPAGYAVPPAGAFDEVPDGYACTYLGGDWQPTEYGWNWTSAERLHFPSSGNFDVSGLMGETGENPLYWSGESFGSGNQGFGKAAMFFEAFDDVYYGIYPILDSAEAASWFSYGAKCIAASVRCVKEIK